MKFLRDLLDVLQFSGNFLMGFLILLSFVVVPLVLPAYGVFLIRKNKKALGRISGVQFFAASVAVLLVWIYFFLEGPMHQMALGYTWLLSALAVFHLGMFNVLGKPKWMKLLGVVLMLAGLYGFVLLVVGRVYSGI